MKMLHLTIMVCISMMGSFAEKVCSMDALDQNPPAIDIATGWEIPSEGYCDQPYVVTLADGTWLCTMTTGTGHEGQTGQHIVSCRSHDRGKTWGSLVDIEPADGPEASWVMPYLTGYGRIYVFYTYNAQNMREVIASTEYARQRVDTLGEYALKYSDDGGLTWSHARWFIPVRETAIDRHNPYQGKVRFFWGVGKPIRHKGAMVLGFSKVGKFGVSFLETSESWFLRCANIEMERDPAKLKWQTLPEGDHGLKSPIGPIAEEVNLVSLSDGSLFCTYRTVAGHPCHAYSRDDGASWTESAFMTYRPGGTLVDHPRAANFVRTLSEGPCAGRHIYWFHNHAGTDFQGRNPAYLLGGIEKDSPEGKVIHWGRPVAVLYSKDEAVRISYPDFIWDDALYITETQKKTARVHRIPNELLQSLWPDMQGQAAIVQPPSSARSVPTRVRRVPVAEVLQRLGARLEQGSSAEELDSYSSHFDRTDPDRDGKHTKAEYVDNGAYMTPQARAGIFRAADGNADGVVTRAEYVLNRIITDEAKAIVQGMDDDKDGLVERAEFVRHATKLLSDMDLAEQVYVALDANADGGIPVPEYLRVWGQWARAGQKPAEVRIASRRAELAELAVSKAPEDCPACAMDLTAEFVFKRLDVNGDRKIAVEEFQKSPGMQTQDQAAEAVGRIDTSGDGVLTWTEFQTAYQIRHADCSVLTKGQQDTGPVEGADGRGDGNRFAQVFILRSDQNGDGRVDRKEFRGSDSGFERMDKNGNGFIESDELNELHETRLADPKTMRQRLQDGDARRPPQRGPGQTGPPSAEMFFFRFDQNGDGRLTEGEVPGGLWQRLRNRDANADGTLTRDEFGKNPGR